MVEEGGVEGGCAGEELASGHQCAHDCVLEGEDFVDEFFFL